MKKMTNNLDTFLAKESENSSFREAFEHYYEALQLGTKVQRLRQKTNLSQKELAEKLGVSQQLISKIESGATENPTLRTLQKIASATGHHLKISFAVN